MTLNPWELKSSGENNLQCDSWSDNDDNLINKCLKQQPIKTATGISALEFDQMGFVGKDAILSINSQYTTKYMCRSA